MDFWQTGILEPLRTFWAQVKIFLPHLILSLGIVVVGLVLGWVLKELVSRVLRAVKFDGLATRLGVATAVERIGGFRSPSYFAGQLVGGAVVVIALLIGLDVLDTTVSHSLVERFLSYLPHLLVAAFILLLGAIISRFLARGVLLAAVNAEVRGASVLAGMVRFLVMAVAVVAALEHLGIGRATVLLAFSIVFGGVVLALAIAFGLGGRDLARDLLEGQLRRRKEDESDEEGVRHV